MSTTYQVEGKQAAGDLLSQDIRSCFASQQQHTLAPLRQAAMDSFESLGFPTVKDEEWKYTNLKNLLNKSYSFKASAQLDRDMLAAQALPADQQAHVLVFVNGSYSPELSSGPASGPAPVVKNLAAALSSHGELIEQHLGQYADFSKDAFTAINTALASDGVFIHIPANTELTAPVVLLFAADAQQENVMVQARNLVLAGTGSRACIVEQFISFGSQHSFTNMVTEIVVEANAQIDHYKLQTEQAGAHHIGTTQVLQKRDSRFSDTTITLSGGIVRNNLNILIDGENCQAYMNGLYLPDGSTHVDNHTLADHRKPHSYSNELYKGLLDGKSTGVFNGKIYVRPDAQKTNAFQSNKNILLSDQAAMNTKPQLEIWADDVKCSHGCTVGALDEEPMFYLRARGIPEAQARALLMFAFAEDVLERIALEPLKIFVEEKIGKKLDVSLA